MSIPATIGPTRKISVRVVPDAVTAAAMRALESAHLSVETVDLGDELAGLAVSLGCRHVAGLNRCEQGTCLVDDHFFGDTARHQLAHEGVQTAAQLGPPASQIVVMLDQQPAHRGVNGTLHRRQ